LQGFSFFNKTKFYKIGCHNDPFDDDDPFNQDVDSYLF